MPQIPDPQIQRVLLAIGAGEVLVEDGIDEDQMLPGISRAVDQGYVRMILPEANGAPARYSKRSEERRRKYQILESLHSEQAIHCAGFPNVVSKEAPDCYQGSKAAVSALERGDGSYAPPHPFARTTNKSLAPYTWRHEGTFPPSRALIIAYIPM